MDIKEIGACGFVVIGGTVFGVSQMGLGAALSEDLKPYHEVSNLERADYMNSVVGEFTETFQTYLVQTGTYDYVGTSKFSIDPDRGLFVEVVSQDEKVPDAELAGIIERVSQDTFCEQEEMKMFTDNGWNYSFTIKHAKTRKITRVICQPKRTGTV